MMAQYPDVFIMTFSIHIPNFVLLSQTAQLLLILLLCRPTIGYIVVYGDFANSILQLFVALMIGNLGYLYIILLLMQSFIRW